MEPGLTLSSITAFVCASLERIISSSCSGATVWSKGTQVSSKRSSATCQFETKKGKNMRKYSCWYVARLLLDSRYDLFYRVQICPNCSTSWYRQNTGKISTLNEMNAHSITTMPKLSNEIKRYTDNKRKQVKKTAVCLDSNLESK